MAAEETEGPACVGPQWTLGCEGAHAMNPLLFCNCGRKPHP